jgi:hypothetical protein
MQTGATHLFFSDSEELPKETTKNEKRIAMQANRIGSFSYSSVSFGQRLTSSQYRLMQNAAKANHSAFDCKVHWLAQLTQCHPSHCGFRFGGIAEKIEKIRKENRNASRSDRYFFVFFRFFRPTIEKLSISAHAERSQSKSLSFRLQIALVIATNQGYRNKSVPPISL